jgi:oligosaccharide repeat unit polymerase
MFKFILITFILFIWMSHTYKRKLHFASPSLFLLFLYFLSVSLSLPHVFVNNEHQSLDSSYFNAALVFIFLLFLFLFPFIKIKESEIKTIILPNNKALYLFSIVIVLLSLFSILYFLPIVINVFMFGDLNVARLQVTQGEGFRSESIVNTIASVSASFYIIAIFLFFIYRAKGTNKTLSIFLLMSSLSYVLNVFAFVGRDGVVFWVFSFIGAYGIFHRFLPHTDKKKIKRVLLYFFITAIPLFMAITYDRFSENPIYGILSYAGQPFPNFCLAFNADYPVSNGASFPLFRELLGMPIVESERVEYGGTYSWVFGTFLKSFITNLDLVGTIMLGIFMGVILLIAFKNTNNRFYFHQLFLYFLYFQVYSQGLFYFRQYTRGGNLYIIVSFLFFFFFQFLNRHERNPIILKTVNK